MEWQDANAMDQDFASRIADAAFPCVGAKSALTQGSLALSRAGDLRCPRADADIVAGLQLFASQVPTDAVFVSRVVLFPDTPVLDEAQFEQELWQRLQCFHEIDRQAFDWDPTVSPNPGDARFSMSLGGRGFYVIGLHPGSSRVARRFGCAALVFNLHSQFEVLRADGRYERLREVITERDVAYSGSRNPMLAMHGEASEARQYSGRQVGPDWVCPFSAGTRALRHGA